MTTKNCCNCGAEKPLDQFYNKNGKYKMGKDSFCKPCRAAWARDYNRFYSESKARGLRPKKDLDAIRRRYKYTNHRVIDARFERLVDDAIDEVCRVFG